MSAEQNPTLPEDSSDLPEQPTDLRTRKKEDEDFGSDSETDNDIDVTTTAAELHHPAAPPSFLIRNLIDGGRNPDEDGGIHPHPPSLARAFHPLLHPPSLHPMFHPHHPFALHPSVMNHHHPFQRESDTEDTERDPSVTSGDEDKGRFKDEEDDEDQDDVTSSKDSQHAADSDLENSVSHSGE